MDVKCGEKKRREKRVLLQGGSSEKTRKDVPKLQKH